MTSYVRANHSRNICSLCEVMFFLHLWLCIDKYAAWLKKDQDLGCAKCGMCRKTFDISIMGEAVLARHAACESALTPITGFFTPGTNVRSPTAIF